MSNEQKLREALQAVIAAHDACMRELGEQMRTANLTNIRIEGQAVIDAFAAIEQARQALATTEPDHFEHVLDMVEPSQPVGEREVFEREMMRRKSWTVYDFQPHPRRGEYPHPDYLTPHANTAWAGWQARAPMAQVSDINVVESFTDDTRDAARYRWLRDDTDSYWAICEWSHDPGDEGYYRDARAPHIVDAAIDAAMAQGVKG